MTEEISIRKTRYGLRLANRWLEVRCRLAEGSLSFRDRAAGRTIIPLAHAAVEMAGDSGAVSTLDGGFRRDYDLQPVSDVCGDGLAVHLSMPSPPPPEADAPPAQEAGPELCLLLTLYESQPFAAIQLEVVNATRRPLGVGAFRVLTAEKLRLGRSPRRWRFYKQGWQSWSPTLSLSGSEPDVRAPPPVVGPYSLSEANKHFTADLIGAVADPTTGSSLLAGFITTADQFSQVWLDVSRRSLSALSFADGISVGPGQTLASEKLLVDVCGPPLDALARYGQTLGRQMGALGWDHVPTGWCSWYYYWGGISEEAMLENLEFLSRHRDELPVEYIQLDDGFQADIGDWTTLNQKFPHSLGWLAQRIHDKGFKAGLWLAPFLAASTSALYRQHPDWVVRDGRGEPVVAIPNWGKDCYGLDCTHPEVQAWLRKLVKTAVQEWGFDYLKLDFLYGAAVEGRRYDPQATRAQAYRRGLDILRQGAGDRFILGCGAPIGLSIGLINANRVGPDVAPFWRLYPPRDNAPLAAPGTENALRTVLARHWTHGSLWLNDPDCLLVRDSETALSLGETHCLATAVALSGGMVFLSDALARLSPQRRQIASLLLPPYGRAAEPLDLLEHSPPRFSQLAVERPFEQWWLLGVFQWDEQPTDVRAPLPAEPVHVYDLWEDRYFGVHQGEILFPAMEPHSAKLLALRRLSDQPQIVSTTFHFSQGGVEIEDARFDAARGALTVELVRPAKKEGEVLVYVPPTYQERAVESDAPAVAMARRPDGLLSVRLTLTERAHLAVLFDH